MRAVSSVVRDEVDDILLQGETTVRDIQQGVVANGENGGPPLGEPNWQHSRKILAKNPSSSPDWLYDFHMNAAAMTVDNIQTFLNTPDANEAVDMAYYNAVHIHVKRIHLLQAMYMDARVCTILFELFSEVALFVPDFENLKDVLENYFPRKMDELYRCIFTAVHVHSENQDLIRAAWSLLRCMHDDASDTLNRMPEHCSVACKVVRFFHENREVMYSVLVVFLQQDSTDDFFDALVGIARDTFSQSIAELMRHYLQKYQSMSKESVSEVEEVQEILMGICTIIGQLWRRLDAVYYECDGFHQTMQVLAECLLSVDSANLSLIIMEALDCLLSIVPRTVLETRQLICDNLVGCSLVEKTLLYWHSSSEAKFDKIGLRIFCSVLTLGIEFSDDRSIMRTFAIERAALLVRTSFNTKEFDMCNTLAADVLFSLVSEQDLNLLTASRDAMIDHEMISFATMVISTARPLNKPSISPISNAGVIHATRKWISILHALVIGNAQNEAKTIRFGIIEILSKLISCVHPVVTTTDLDKQVVIFLSALVPAQYQLILRRNARHCTTFNPTPDTYMFSGLIQSVSRAIERPVGNTTKFLQCSLDLMYFLFEKDKLCRRDTDAIFSAIRYVLRHNISQMGVRLSAPIVGRILEIVLFATQADHISTDSLRRLNFVFPREMAAENTAAAAQVKTYLEHRLANPLS